MSNFHERPDCGPGRRLGQTMKTSRRTLRILLSAMLVLWTGLPALAGAARAQKAQSRADRFYIISSVDAKKKQIVLKLPTEVTEVVEVTPATIYRDEKGKPLRFEDLRAGDTVYATVIQNAGGHLTVVHIRRGPMTLEELHRRYLREE